MMRKLTLPEKVVEFLKQNTPQKFLSKDIAKAIAEQYAAEYASKKAGFDNEQAFIQQLAAEIKKSAIMRICPEIQVQDKPKRLFWYESQFNLSNNVISPEITNHDGGTISEHDLYPKLMQFLSEELGLYCLRIDEKRSKNNRGSRGNQWLHPDVVAMQAVDKQWSDDIRQCVKLGSGQHVFLWSFEVKLELNGSNVRESFFQAVSNSSWANEGYLVATKLIGEHTSEELRTLSALHGIGVIILNLDNLSESEIWLPAKRKEQTDWQSVNRIVEQNQDFETFIEYVAIYYQSGKIVEKNWNK